jgi:hypothetical protein
MTSTKFVEIYTEKLKELFGTAFLHIYRDHTVIYVIVSEDITIQLYHMIKISEMFNTPKVSYENSKINFTHEATINVIDYDWNICGDNDEE